MFIDSVKLSVKSGDGGAGCVSFRREKFVILGGPDGGDGGDGGDVYFKVDKNSHTLSSYKGKREFKAQNGAPGEGRKKTGKSGEDLYLIVPPGTSVYDEDSGELVLDMLNDGETRLFLKGGKGGLGNVHFKSSINQAPEYAQKGLEGQTREVRLELKLIADVGLVGFPNVGKSTLISTVSNAKPQIANYEFTTLTPKLGLVEVDEYSGFGMADIPGIIEGDYAIALTRADAAENLQEKFDAFLSHLGLAGTEGEMKFKQDIYEFDAAKPFFVMPISSATGQNINELKFNLLELLKKEL